jgi:RNA polymerase sigma-70 factor (ECF subfamily)
MLNVSVEKRLDSDATLVALAKAGDRLAFEQLIARHYQSCVNMASSMLRDRSEAQDQVQEAWWKAFDRLEQFHGDSEFLTWMLRIVVNQCLALLRTRRRTQFCYIDDDGGRSGSRSMELPAVTPDPEYVVVSCELQETLRNEIRHIPRLLRDVVSLHLQGLPMHTVAGLLGISVVAAKSRLRRARAELRSRLMEKSGNARHCLPVGSVIPAKSYRRAAWAS